MKKTKKSNRGFTLIELVIAMAILAFLMTAVSSFMGTGVLSFKKTKADIDVHNTAQAVYDQIADGIMSAKEFIVCAYVIDGTLDGSVATSTDATFLKAGDISDQTMDGPYYFVRDEEQKKMLQSATSSISKYYLSGNKGFKLYTDVPEGARLYVKQLIIDKAIAIDTSCSTELNEETLPKEVTNALTGQKDTISLAVRDQDNTIVTEAPAPDADIYATTASMPVYNVNDTERCVYDFEDKTVYLQREYAYMDLLNDYYVGASAPSKKKGCKYSESLNYLKLSDDDDADSVSGCILRLDASKSAFYLELYFSDKNTTYSTSSMINTRNSYVLKPKK